MTEWEDTEWTEREEGGIEFKVGGPITRIYGTICPPHKDAVDIGLINNISCLNCEVDKLRARLKFVTECNEAMRAPMMRLREQMGMPAEGESTVIDEAIRALKAAGSNNGRKG